jgi:soluble lytic murein transglycosylase-like protein
MTTADVQALIRSEALARGVDPALALAVASQESGFNPYALSSKGAVGVFQLMPGTAAGLGVDPYDVTQNIQGGVAYLSQLSTQFGGDVSLTLAAYNAGPGNVAKYGGVPPFAETQSYVSRILAALGISSAGNDTAAGNDTGASSDAGIVVSPVAFAAAGVVLASVAWWFLR